MVITNDAGRCALQELRSVLRTPISHDNPVGERVLDDPLLDFIESQMMKVGSLAHGEVRWDEVEVSIVSLMKNKTKDLKLLVHLMQCLQQSNSVERFVLSIQILSEFMGTYWESCFPAPGLRGALPRKKFFTQMVQRTDTALDKLIQSDAFVSETMQQELVQAKNDFSQVSMSLGLSGEYSIALINGLERWLTSCRQSSSSSSTSGEYEEVRAATEKTQTTEAQAVSSSLDTNSLKSAKQSMQKMADYLSENEYGYALSIRLRRHSVWLSISTPPDSNAAGETSLRSMPQDRVREYFEQFQHRPNLTLWRQVEQSLLNAPFWFEGQYLSAQIALKLGQPRWAEAILDETLQFLKRLPELGTMSFKDGQPFISEETKQWLNTQSAIESHSMVVGSWDDKREEAFRLAKEGGLSVAMAMLNDGLVQCSEPRDQCYWRLISADLLASQGLDAMAYQHYQSLYQIVTQSTVQDWEPTLVQQLEKIVITE